MRELAQTHTEREQLVYEVMYRETIARGITDRHFPVPEILALLDGRRKGHVAVRHAIDGLQRKRSIATLHYRHGSPSGPLYRVFAPPEILDARRSAGIQIDPVSKQPLADAFVPSFDPASSRPRETGQTELTGLLASAGALNRPEVADLIRALASALGSEVAARTDTD